MTTRRNYNSAVKFKIGAESATCRSACAKGSGNVFPRFAARRRMPEQAFALKQYGRRWSPVSKIADNEDATPSLGNSEVLSVKNAVGEPIPEFAQRPEEDSKRSSSVCRQDARNVFPKKPAGTQPFKKAYKLNGKSPAIASKPRTKSGNAEVLAGRSPDKKVNCSKVRRSDLCEVAVVRNGRKAMREYGARERVDLRDAGAAPAQRLPGYARTLDARAHREIPHSLPGAFVWAPVAGAGSVAFCIVRSKRIPAWNASAICSSE
jgi:hypothetical protein